jgi:hypothetical protein
MLQIKDTIHPSLNISDMPFRKTPIPHDTHSFASPVLMPAFSTFFFRRYQSNPFAKATASRSLEVHWNNGSGLREVASSP